MTLSAALAGPWTTRTFKNVSAGSAVRRSLCFAALLGAGSSAIAATAPAAPEDAAHRCVGTWAYVPKDMDTEAGFSVAVNADAVVLAKFSDYGTLKGKAVAVGDPYLVRIIDEQDPAAPPIYFVCADNGRATSAILNGTGYVLQPIKGDIFDAEKARGRKFDD